jgi:hypothetical protein
LVALLEELQLQPVEGVEGAAEPSRSLPCLEVAVGVASLQSALMVPVVVGLHSSAEEPEEERLVVLAL